MNDIEKQIVAEFWELRDRVRYYILSKIYIKQDAEDLVSDVYAKVCANAQRYDSTKSAKITWIYTIAHNTVVDYLKKGRIKTSELDEKLADNFNVENDIICKQQSEELFAALQSLPERERDIVLLKYYDGYNAAEIGQIMNIEHSNVRTLLMRAMQKLRKIVEK